MRIPFSMLLFLAAVLSGCSSKEHAIVKDAAPPRFDIGQLQGAWWPKDPSPTAAFAIEGDEAWFDYDSQYHPTWIDGDVLVFDHGPVLGLQKLRILSVDKGRLVLKDLAEPSKVEVFTLARPGP